MTADFTTDTDVNRGSFTQPNEDLTSKVEQPQSDSILAGYSVLAKSMIGSGMMLLASACAVSGWVLGLGLLFGAALCTFMSLYFLSAVSLLYHSSSSSLSYLRLCSELLPKRFRRVMDVAVILKCIGASTAYLIFTGQCVSSIIVA